MNKQRANSKSKNPQAKLIQIIEYLQDESVRFILGICFLLFTIYMITAMISFFFTGANDQSMLKVGFVEYIGNSDLISENWTGKLGAFLSNLLINKAFGVSAFLFNYLLFLMSFRLLGYKLDSITKSFIKIFIVCLWFSSTISFFFVSENENDFLYFGGLHGFYINKWITSFIGNIGAVFIYFIGLLGLVAYFLPNIFNRILEFKVNKVHVFSSLKLESKTIGKVKKKFTNMFDFKFSTKDNSTTEFELDEDEEEAVEEQKIYVTKHVPSEPAQETVTETDSEIEEESKPIQRPVSIQRESNREIPKEKFNDDIEEDIVDDMNITKEMKAPENIDPIEPKSEINIETKIENETEEVSIQDDLKSFIDFTNKPKPHATYKDETVEQEADLMPQAGQTHELIHKHPDESPENQNSNKNTELELETYRVDEETVSAYNRFPQEDFDPTLDLSKYQFPTIDLLEEHQSGGSVVSKEELETNKNNIVETLRNYKIEITQIKATIGPTVTLYEIVPAPGVRISKIKNLEDDIALSLAALGIRIIAPIPGKGTIGIEVPNQTSEVVSMRNIISSRRFQESNDALPVALGKTISNETYTFDLTKMPHLLVAGATGQGKSVGLNAIITSLLYKKHPSQLKFVLIDPKKVELSIYSSIEKHYLAKLPTAEEPIITDIHKVISTLNSLCVEMDSRYDLLKKANARNIKEYNTKFVKRRLNPQEGHRYLPYIVVVIDEFADLIMTAGKEVEQPIARIAQLARAIGIHMIIATQRPSTNIITGVIKANFPARIAFKVASMIDSRTILDSPGANQLIGRGDMLISNNSDLVRVQCAFVDTPEIEDITEYIKGQQSYPSALLLPDYVSESSEGSADITEQKKDSLFEEAAKLIVNSQQGSTSAIQRRFSIGYNRAGRIIDQLEAAGIVGPFEGSKARQVLVHDEYSLNQILENL
ncbi:MAG: DNA translocase FtsK [Marinifilaceae bacterium]|jgi:S-DNA-T family DNA segregation ATPase FtsK/SpoIIIE|nr:DNA translocase FtsK [Marinifilaceae bacterium]